MTATLDMLVQFVETLPSLPVAAVRMLALVEDPKASVGQMVSVIRADPALTAKVLKVVNSAMYGFSRRIGRLEQAIPLIGTNALRQICVSISVLEAMKLADPAAAGLDPDGFWEHSFACAVTAKILAPDLGVREPEAAFVGGLTHDLGKLFLAQFAPDALAEAIAEAAERRLPLYQVERQRLGTDHAQLGGTVAQHWSLMAQHVAAIRFHHGGLPEELVFEDLREMVATVALANQYIKAVEFGRSGCPRRRLPAVIHERLGLRTTAAQDHFRERVAQSVRDVRSALSA